MRADYTDIFQAASAVEKYESVVYGPQTYGAAVNARQRTYLRWLARRHSRSAAAGAARLRLRHRTGHPDAARVRAGGARLRHIPGDAGSGQGVRRWWPRCTRSGRRARCRHRPDAGRPALVTVFRLLLNVPDEVRERAIAFAAQVLARPEDGLLVVENHGNRQLDAAPAVAPGGPGTRGSTSSPTPGRRAAGPARLHRSWPGAASPSARPGRTAAAGYARWPGAWTTSPPGSRWLAPVATTVLYVARRV